MDEGCVVKRASPSGVGIHVVVGHTLYVEHRGLVVLSEDEFPLVRYRTGTNVTLPGVRVQGFGGHLDDRQRADVVRT
jgi:hypothetical protein